MLRLNLTIPDAAILSDSLANPEVLVEITDKCNFHCPYCFSNEVNGRIGFMSRELFDHVITQLPSVTTNPLFLHVAGEPTLHPEFHRLAGSANARGIRLLLATNGSRLKARFLELEMDLMVYLSTEREEFSKRSSASFDDYLESISRYLAAWRESGSPQNISLVIYFTSADRSDPARTKRKISCLRSFLGASGLRAWGALPDDGVGVNLCHRRGDGRTARVRDIDLLVGGCHPNPENISLPGSSHSRGSGYGFCDSAWHRLAVLVDGRLAYCCRDLTGGTAYTTPEQILRSPLKNLWLGHPKINKIRRELLECRVRNPVCQECLDAHPTRQYKCRG